MRDDANAFVTRARRSGARRARADGADAARARSAPDPERRGRARTILGRRARGAARIDAVDANDD